MDQKLAQSLASQAEKAFRSKKYTEAAELFEKAAREYQLAGDALKAAEMANNRSVSLLQSGDGQGALEAAQGTDAIFAQAGDIYRQALAIGNQASALEALGQLEEALDRFTQCADLLKQIGEKDQRAVVLKSISTLQLRTGRQFEAVATMDAALNNQKKLSATEKLLKKVLDIPMNMMGIKR